MKIAVVTGAGRGLGRCVAEGLSKRGFTVLATDIDGAAAEETARALGGQSWSMQQDVRDSASHRRVAEAALARGHVEVWVNNAGVMRTAAAWEHDDAEVELQMDVNVLGVIWGSRSAVEAMRPNAAGHIINIASISALTPVPGLAVYGASKHAVLGFSLSLQGDLDHVGLPIHVSAICPDAIDTDMTREVAHQETSALLFSSTKMLNVQTMAELVLSVLDKPRLMLVRPRYRGALAHLLRPFPEFGLKLLKPFRKLGERQRQRRQG